MDPVSAFGKIPAVFVHLKADLPLDLHHVVHNGLHVHIVAELHAQTSAQALSGGIHLPVSLCTDRALTEHIFHKGILCHDAASRIIGSGCQIIYLLHKLSAVLFHLYLPLFL